MKKPKGHHDTNLLAANFSLTIVDGALSTVEKMISLAKSISSEDFANSNDEDECRDQLLKSGEKLVGLSITRT